MHSTLENVWKISFCYPMYSDNANVAAIVVDNILARVDQKVLSIKRLSVSTGYEYLDHYTVTCTVTPDTDLDRVDRTFARAIMIGRHEAHCIAMESLEYEE